jgi:hypothetical protein
LGGLFLTNETWAAQKQAAEPLAHIDRIELFLTNQITIHFETLPGWIYELQYLEEPVLASAGSMVSLNGWSNLFVAPKLPFHNHYVVVDYRTNRARFYRLRVTP